MLLPTVASARWNRSGMPNDEPSGGYRLPGWPIDKPKGPRSLLDVLALSVRVEIARCGESRRWKGHALCYEGCGAVLYDISNSSYLHIHNKLTFASIRLDAESVRVAPTPQSTVGRLESFDYQSA